MAKEVHLERKWLVLLLTCLLFKPALELSTLDLHSFCKEQLQNIGITPDDRLATKICNKLQLLASLNKQYYRFHLLSSMHCNAMC